VTRQAGTEPQPEGRRPWVRWVAPALVSLAVGVLLAGLWPKERSGPMSSMTPFSTPSGTLACTAADVSAESNFEGATGSLAGSIVITNAGLAGCVLYGPPLAVELRSGDHVLSVSLTTYHGLLADNPVPATAVLLGPGERASSFVLWSNWCAGDLATLEMLVVLPDGSGPLRTSPEAIGGNGPVTVPRCDNPAAPSSLGVFAFTLFPR
jgi:hypothetical protein